MIISRQFQKKFFGDYVKDFFENYGQIIIPDFMWEDGSKLLLKKYDDYEDSDKLRFYLKIFDVNFPKDENGKPLSMAAVDSKVVINHIEYLRYVLANNGVSFKSDDEEWERVKQQYK